MKEGRGGAKLYDGEQAWFSINHMKLSVQNSFLKWRHSKLDLHYLLFERFNFSKPYLDLLDTRCIEESAPLNSTESSYQFLGVLYKYDT